MSSIFTYFRLNLKNCDVSIYRGTSWTCFCMILTSVIKELTLPKVTTCIFEELWSYCWLVLTKATYWMFPHPWIDKTVFTPSDTKTLLKCYKYAGGDDSICLFFRKIGRISKVLHPRTHPISIGCAISPNLLAFHLNF